MPHNIHLITELLLTGASNVLFNGVWHGLFCSILIHPNQMVHDQLQQEYGLGLGFKT